MLVVGIFSFSNKLLHRHEFLLLGKDILLVDLVGEDYDVLLVSPLYDVLQRLLVKELACRVPWVDYTDGLDLRPGLFGLLIRLLNLLHRDGPPSALIQLIPNDVPLGKSDDRGIQRVLGDRHHDALVGPVDQ